ncbi:plakophilin-1-like [Brachionichthys hirsutus]|uniref:plakophilin-1-like n=1 Tax=Brachionichthys hirsutus TaxID=412623 RepID=UPI0036050D80
MATLEPLKSVVSFVNATDTSLALPSVNQYRSGQQRVTEQVQSIRRGRSRSSSSRSASAPTSPVYDSVFVDGIKSQLFSSNGSAFFGTGLSKTLSHGKNASWHGADNMNGSRTKRNMSAPNCQYRARYSSVGAAAVDHKNSGHSEPVRAQRHATQRCSVSQQRLQLSNSGSHWVERPTGRVGMSPTSQPQLHPLSSMMGTARTQAVKGTAQNQANQSMMGTAQAKSMKSRGQTQTNAQFVGSQLSVSKAASKPPGAESELKSTEESGAKGNSGVAQITMKEAVECLSNPEGAFQRCGASYIQHHTYSDANAKEEVLRLSGIPPLVALLRSPSSEVTQAASAALRNLSYKNNSNKEEIHRCGGVAEAVNLLRDADSADLQKQLTGLLWNVSSIDSLKPDLLKSALPVLMERVVLPYTAGPDRNVSDAEVFFHTTGCLRNLSSAKQNSRQVMRKWRGLIDSLVGYVSGCVEAENPDDKSLENCVCVLHNLTFQLEAEAPTLFSRITALARPMNGNHGQGDAGPIGCFSPQGRSLAHERHFDFPITEDPHPTGAGWLIHSKTLQNYLSLLSASQHEETQEACCGALQNLTVNEGIVSGAMSQIVVQKLNGLKSLVPLLKSNKVNVQRNTMALVGNLTKNSKLHSVIARKALPDLLSILSAGTKEGNESDDTLAMACQTANSLLMKEPEMGKHLVNDNLIVSLIALSQNKYYPKSRKTATDFLHNLWSSKVFQSSLRKQGITKSSFGNDVTASPHKPAQALD